MKPWRAKSKNLRGPLIALAAIGLQVVGCSPSIGPSPPTKRAFDFLPDGGSGFPKIPLEPNPHPTQGPGGGPDFSVLLDSDVIPVYDHTNPQQNCGAPGDFPDAVGAMRDPVTGRAILVLGGPGWSNISYREAPGENFGPHNPILVGPNFDQLRRPCPNDPQYEGPRSMASGPSTDRFGDYYSLLWWGGRGYQDPTTGDWTWIVYNETHGDFYSGTGITKPPGGDNDEETVSIRFRSYGNGLPGTWFLADEDGKPTQPSAEKAPHLVAQFGTGARTPKYAPLVDEWTYTTSAAHVNNELIKGPDGHFYVLTDFGAVSNLGHTTLYPGWDPSWMPPENGHVFCLGRTTEPTPYSKFLYMDQNGEFTLDYTHDPYRDRPVLKPRWCQPLDFFKNHTALGLTPNYTGGQMLKASITYNLQAQKYLAIGYSNPPDIDCLQNVVAGNFSHPSVVQWGPRQCKKPGFYYSLSEDLVDWTPAQHIVGTEVFKDQQYGQLLYADPSQAGQGMNHLVFNYGVSFDPNSPTDDLSVSDDQIYFFFQQSFSEPAQPGDEVCPVYQSGNLYGGGTKNYGSYSLFSNLTGVELRRPLCQKRLISLIKFRVL